MATFCYYLKAYIRELAYSDTMSLKALAEEAANRNARLREPLFCYAAATGQLQRLLKITTGLYAKLHEEYAGISAACGGDYSRLYEMLKNEDARLPNEYLKVYRSYRWSLNKPEFKRQMKDKYRMFVLMVQKSLPELTNYRIYTGLGLNPGNINAYLKHGDLSKVSAETAEKIFDYADSFAKQKRLFDTQ